MVEASSWRACPFKYGLEQSRQSIARKHNLLDCKATGYCDDTKRRMFAVEHAYAWLTGVVRRLAINPLDVERMEVRQACLTVRAVSHRRPPSKAYGCYGPFNSVHRVIRYYEHACPPRW